MSNETLSYDAAGAEGFWGPLHGLSHYCTKTQLYNFSHWFWWIWVIFYRENNFWLCPWCPPPALPHLSVIYIDGQITAIAVFCPSLGSLEAPSQIIKSQMKPSAFFWFQLHSFVTVATQSCWQIDQNHILPWWHWQVERNTSHTVAADNNAGDSLHCHNVVDIDRPLVFHLRYCIKMCQEQELAM